MLSIKVLGPGCANCKKMEATAQKAVDRVGVEAEIVKVTDYGEIMSYNIMSTPGLVIDETVVAAGRIPKDEEVVAWITEAMSAN